MLKRIKRIKGVGSYVEARAADVEFGDVNIIYGENRNGKSTLCDTFSSLADGDPEPIMSRSAITPDGEMILTPYIKLQFEDDGDVEFSNGKWNKQLQASSLYVFDQGFAHRNVMAGVEVIRDNSEQVSDFILGEEGVKIASKLKEKRQASNDARKYLQAAKQNFTTINIQDPEQFTSLEKPSASLSKLQSDLDHLNKKIELARDTANNLERLHARPEPTSFEPTPDYCLAVERANECLKSSIADVHVEANRIVNAQLNKVKDPQGCKSWIATGLKYIETDCPFCGQALSDDASALLDAYQQSFDDEFQRFIRTTKKQAFDIREQGIPNVDVDSFGQRHQVNITHIDAFDEISELLAPFKTELNKTTELLYEVIPSLNRTLDELFREIHSKLSEKVESPFRPQEAITDQELRQKLEEFTQVVRKYDEIIVEVNNLISQHKQTLNLADKTKEIEKLLEMREVVELNKKRLEYDELCSEYQQLKEQAQRTQSDYETRKSQLEEDQEQFLNGYFEEINRLFKELGSTGFEINHKFNNKGMRPVYDLEVTFNNRRIPRSNFNSLFSESDRRALALCIFIAKINKLPTGEQGKAVLIMDDPCTSFDTERFRLIMKNLNHLRSRVKQIIITTHFKQLAARVVTHFDSVVALKIQRSDQGSYFERATEAELTDTAHDENFKAIMEMVKGTTKEKRITQLRPFFEHEIRQRFKAQLDRLGVSNKASLSTCTRELYDKGMVDADVFRDMENYRNELNPEMHTLNELSFSDLQSFSASLIEFIYERMKPI